MQPTSLPFLFFGFADGWVPLSRGLLPQQNTGASGRILGLSSIHCRPQSQQTSVYIAHGSRRDSSSTVRGAIATSYHAPPSSPRICRVVPAVESCEVRAPKSERLQRTEHCARESWAWIGLAAGIRGTTALLAHKPAGLRELHLRASVALTATTYAEFRVDQARTPRATAGYKLARSLHTPATSSLSSSSLATSLFSRTPAAARPSLAIRRRRGPTSIRRRLSLSGGPCVVTKGPWKLTRGSTAIGVISGALNSSSELNHRRRPHSAVAGAVRATINGEIPPVCSLSPEFCFYAIVFGVPAWERAPHGGCPWRRCGGSPRRPIGELGEGERLLAIRSLSGGCD